MENNLKFLFLCSLIFMFYANKASANICGTDYQNFNPTTNGIDFVTVQSSETLKPCILNMGFFMNYAANSLTYSQTLNADYKNGQKRKDRILSADINVGFGLTENWDMGVNLPVLLNSVVSNDYYVASFDGYGITEFKANTKYRLLSHGTNGLALVFSINKNLLQNNPFVGNNAGLTYNYELVADTKWGHDWAFAFNYGYRDRNPGTPLVGNPFVPLDDQWIYSIAGSYLASSIDTKFIFEIYGSRPVTKINEDTDRNLNTLEALMGVKYDYSQNLALHLGGTQQMNPSMGGAEWRLYAGLNWAIGPICNKKIVEQTRNIENHFVSPTESQSTSSSLASSPSSLSQTSSSLSDSTTTVQHITEPEVIKLDVQLLYKFDSEVFENEELEKIHEFFKETLSKDFQRLIVEGHTDSRGPVLYNQKLSERRALLFRKHLIDQFQIPGDKIEAFGYGSEKPIASNGNYQGRKQNRRLEIKIWRAKPQ